MRIAIDGSAVSHPQPGGFRTYSIHLVQALAELATDHEFVLYLERPAALDLPPNWEMRVVSRRLPVVGIAVRQQVGLPAVGRRCPVDLLHSPCATGPLVYPSPTVVTILDTIEFSTPLPGLYQTHQWAMRVYTRVVQPRVARTAQIVVTVSQYSKRCIVERFQVPPERVVVTYLAPATFSGYAQDRLGQAVVSGDSPQASVLALASASPRKNIDRLLEAYRLLDRGLRQRFPLLVICTHKALRGRLERRSEELGIAPDVRFLEGVADQALHSLMTAASLFVYPSLEEGFGLPPLKAMACGTPVVASNTSSLPEVLGDAALLVPPADAQAIAEAMAAVLTTPSLAADLSERGLARSRQFSWEATARQTLEVYETVLEGVT